SADAGSPAPEPCYTYEVQRLLSYGRVCSRLLYQTLDEKLQMAAGIGRQRPGVNFLSYRLERQRACGSREGSIDCALLLHGLAHALIVGHGSDALEGDIEEAIGHFGQLSKEIAPCLRAVGHVGQDAEAADAV